MSNVSGQALKLKREFEEKYGYAPTEVWMTLADAKAVTREFDCTFGPEFTGKAVFSGMDINLHDGPMEVMATLRPIHEGSEAAIIKRLDRIIDLLEPEYEEIDDDPEIRGDQTDCQD